MHRGTLGRTCVAVGFALFTLACARQDADEYGMEGTGMDTVSSPGEVALTPGSLRVADIMDNPTQYIGDTITVEADVEEVLGTYAFVLDEDDPVAGGIDNDLMVFSARSAMLADIDDQWLNNRVRVTGVVRQATVAEIEREIEWDLTPDVETKVDGTKPVLIAHSFQHISGG
jgi:hypothetical protein